MTSILRAITDQWTPGRDRVLWTPVLFGVGIALYFSVESEPTIPHAAGIFAVAAVLCLALWRRLPGFIFVGIAVLLVVAGFNAAVWRTYVVAAPQISRELGPVGVTGLVEDVTVADENDGRSKRQVTLSTLTIDRLTPEATPATIRLTSYHVPADVGPGDTIYVLARLMPPSGPVAPGGFNYRRQAFFSQLGAVGFTLGKFELKHKGQPSRVEQWFSRWQQVITQRITAVLPDPEGTMTAALLAGERAGMEDDVTQALIDAGIYHLISISGLHVAIVCGFTFFTLRFVMALWPYAALRLPIKKIAALAALLAGLFYMMLAGAPVPTQRAMIMTGVMLVAVMLDRSALSIRTIALAALLLLALHPEALIGASFQLSFAAVLAMIAFYEDIGRKYMITEREAGLPRRALMYLAGIAVTTILVGVATLPAVLHHFGRLQVYGILGNAAAIPLTTFIVMPFGMVGMLMMPLGLDEPFLTVAGWGVDATLNVARWVAGLPHAVIATAGLPIGYYLAATFGFIFLSLWRGPLRWAGVPFMLVGVILGLLAPRPDALMDADGRSFAIKSHGEIAYALKRPSDFTRRNWVGLWGGTEFQDGRPVREIQWESGGASMVCDDWACRITRSGRTLSIVKSRTVLHEECAWASLVVILDKAAYKARCGTARITGWDLRDGGGYAFSAAREGWEAAAFKGAAEKRPWSVGN